MADEIMLENLVTFQLGNMEGGIALVLAAQPVRRNFLKAKWIRLRLA
jgi:hypothetical protein